MKTRVAVTTEEVSPGVPLWDTNQVVTDLPTGETKVALENLVAGKTYYVKTWNEDEFGNRSRELVRVVNTAAPTIVLPLSVSANGVFDSDDPMRAFVKVPTGAVVEAAKITLAFREFFAQSRSAASSGALTSETDGGTTTPSGGGSTSGASSAGSSASIGHSHVLFSYVDGTPSGSAIDREYAAENSAPGSTSVTLATVSTGSDIVTSTDGSHSHTIAHTHSTPSHTHDVPDHAHSVPGHVHDLVYGTFEETFPTSFNVKVRVYRRSGSTFSLIDTIEGLTQVLCDIDLTDVITGQGDWRIEVQSSPAQPNNGRLGCDLFGLLLVRV